MSEFSNFYRTFRPHLTVHRRNSHCTMARARWVKNYHPGEGMKMRAIRAIYGYPGRDQCPMAVLLMVLHEATNGVPLNKLHLLVAPGSSSQPQKIHFIRKDKRLYVGVTSIEEREVDVLCKFENLFKYEISFTDLNFSARAFVRDRKLLDKLLNHESDGPFHSNLTHKRIRTKVQSIGVQVDLGVPLIRALDEPRIPVRMRKPVTLCPKLLR